MCDRYCEWKVRASPGGSLVDLETSNEYPYLFWEADSEDGRVVRSFELGGTPSFCVAGERAGKTVPCIFLAFVHCLCAEKMLAFYRLVVSLCEFDSGTGENRQRRFQVSRRTHE